ncbi:hypothetical protein [Nostoc sp. ChiQUE01b]|uniref:hypothetical protein n=1 Tax=Nostoc sp. ChiQUE01b TaxID=3075376 RepID=UPI002AD2A516|nr:hypothetical protein [Nostoc sp. ChiQUE01b]MDZ8259549.1 hypothetical protein [Nostoc sp. ChiQUE01b]
MIQSNKHEECKNKLIELQEDISKTIEQIPEKIKKINFVLTDEVKIEIVKQTLLLQRLETLIYKKQKKFFKNKCEHRILQSKFSCIKNTLDFLCQNDQYIEIGNNNHKKHLEINKNNHKKYIEIAKKIRHEVEYFLNPRESFFIFGHIKNFFQHSVRDFLTPTKVLVGLAMVIPIYSIGIPLILTTASILTITPEMITYSIYRIARVVTKEAPSKEVVKIAEKTVTNKLTVLFSNSSLIIMVAFAGAFGSIVSIFIRLDQYKDTDYKDSAVPIIVGFAKPLIGTAFGVLVFAMINSNIISFPVLKVNNSSANQVNNSLANNKQPSDQNNDAKYFLYFTLAFLVGFSERLANDIVRRAEATFSPLQDTIQDTGKELQKEIKDTGEGIKVEVKDTGEKIKNEFKGTLKNSEE